MQWLGPGEVVLSRGFPISDAPADCSSRITHWLPASFILASPAHLLFAFRCNGLAPERSFYHEVFRSRMRLRTAHPALRTGCRPVSSLPLRPIFSSPLDAMAWPRRGRFIPSFSDLGCACGLLIPHYALAAGQFHPCLSGPSSLRL